MADVVLRGSSWDHPRGHAPMVATAAAFSELTESRVLVEWVPRSLREFGARSVADLAAEFDLLVIDHPHVGTMARSGVVIALDTLVDAETLRSIGRSSTGGSFASYSYDSHQWALPIDVACQVSAYRPDLLPDPPRTWDGVVELAGEGRVVWPLCDVDALCSFFTLLAHAGKPCCTEGVFADASVAEKALELMAVVASSSEADCSAMNPIRALDLMTGSEEARFAPLLFGYLNYARADQEGARVRFGDIPVASPALEPTGSLLGGAGIAVSARCAAAEEAAGYASYVASGQVQRTVYLRSGGQPAHVAAWGDRAADELAGGFFSDTRRTLDLAWTRPRAAGFDELQNQLFAAFADWPRKPSAVKAFLRRLQALFEQSIDR